MKNIQLIILLVLISLCISCSTIEKDFIIVQNDLNLAIEKGNLKFKAFCTGMTDNEYIPGLSQKEVDKWIKDSEDFECIYYEHTLGISGNPFLVQIEGYPSVEEEIKAEEKKREETWSYADKYNKLLLKHLETTTEQN